MWIYEKNKTNVARYVLGEIEEKILVCIGINPSDATPNKLDKTVSTVKKISLENGYTGWIMLNIYPQIEKEPDCLSDIKNDEIHKENIEEIKKILKENKFDIWCAWGETIKKREYLKECLYEIYFILRENNNKYFQLGTLTKSGHPRHPSRISGDSKFSEFNIQNYIEKMKESKPRKIRKN